MRVSEWMSLLLLAVLFLPSFVLLKNSEINSKLCALYKPKYLIAENTEFSFAKSFYEETPIEFMDTMDVIQKDKAERVALGHPFYASCPDQLTPEEQKFVKKFFLMIFKLQQESKASPPNRFKDPKSDDSPKTDSQKAEEYYQRPYSEDYIAALRSRASKDPKDPKEFILLGAHSEEKFLVDSAILAPQTSRVVGYADITHKSQFVVKNTEFSLESFMGIMVEREPLLNAAIDKGTMLIFRLSPQDPHTVYLPFPGTVIDVIDMDAFVSTVKYTLPNEEITTVVTHHSRKLLKIVSNTKTWFLIFVGNHCGGGIQIEDNIPDKEKVLPVLSKIGKFKLFGSTVMAIFPKDMNVRPVHHLAPKKPVLKQECKESYVEFGQPVAYIEPPKRV